MGEDIIVKEVILMILSHRETVTEQKASIKVSMTFLL